MSNDSTLGSLGLDSLMAVEVKQVLEREFDLNFTMKEIRALTVTSLRAAEDAMSSKDPSVASGDSGNESLPSISGECRGFAVSCVVTEGCRLKFSLGLTQFVEIDVLHVLSHLLMFAKFAMVVTWALTILLCTCICHNYCPFSSNYICFRTAAKKL